MSSLFETIESFLSLIIAPLEWIMLFLVIGGGLYLTIHSRAYPITRIKSAFKLLFSNEASSSGISRFQALSSVLAATVVTRTPANRRNVKCLYLKRYKVHILS